MKKVIFIGFLLSFISLIMWQVQQFSFTFDTSIDSKLHGIRTQVAWLYTIGLYIAWRVTPEAKQ